VDFDIENRAHGLQATTTFTVKLSLDTAVHDNSVGQAFALHLNGDFGPRHEARIIKVERGWQ
jgi:hypothetical protein